MKKIIRRISILLILVFVFTLTTPITRVSLAQTCITGTDCPSDNDSGADGPKTPPPPKDNSWMCILFGRCSA